MNYSVDLSDSAIDEIRPLPANLKRRIANALDRIGENPRLGKPLKWELNGLWSLRIGDYRIIYEIDDVNQVVSVVHARHRRDVYRRR